MDDNIPVPKLIQLLKQNNVTAKQLVDLKSTDGAIQSHSSLDPTALEANYAKLKTWIGKSIEPYQEEMSRVLYPLFVYIFLHLINHSKKDTSQAKHFFDLYKQDFAELHQSDLNNLSAIKDKKHVLENDAAQLFLKNQFVVRMSQASTILLTTHLREKEYFDLLGLLIEHIELKSIQSRPGANEAVSNAGGGVVGTTDIDRFNSKPVLLGPLPMDAEAEAELERSLKGTPIWDQFEQARHKDKDSPARDRVPFPPRKLSELSVDHASLEDARKRVALSRASLPSICFYTFHNTHDSMNCASVSEDAQMMAAGFAESYVRVWSLTGKNLRAIRPKPDVPFNPRSTDEKDLEQYREERGSDNKKLIGHSGPVYATKFSPDNRFLLSCSEDKSVRFWSLDTFTTLVAYKGHNYPVWDVEFSPEQGYYFATASHDRTARLWSVDHIYPLRIFAGHTSDVNTVKFTPNSNYVLTGSSDKTVRLWDIHSGSNVRNLALHTAPVFSVAISPDGKTVASAGEDRNIILWDLAMGKPLKTLHGHADVIHSLAFSRDGTLLASGSGDHTVRIWDVKSGEDSEKKKNDLIKTFATKRTPVYNVQFTRRNLLLGCGPFQP